MELQGKFLLLQSPPHGGITGQDYAKPSIEHTILNNHTRLLGRRARYAGTYDLSLCVACCSRMHGVCAMLCGGVRFYTCTGSHIPSQASCGCAGSCPVFRITARFAEGSALQGPRAEEQGGTPHQ